MSARDWLTDQQLSWSWAMAPEAVSTDPVRRMRDALLAVLDLHHSDRNGWCEECSGCDEYVPWPCATIRTVSRIIDDAVWHGSSNEGGME